jgi:hypothetical protein
MILTCNCPCYIARPQLRFVLFTFFIILRIIAIIVYASDKTVRDFGYQMAVVCTVLVVLIIPVTQNLSLDHIAIFHASDYIPQRHCEPGEDKKYIVFHQTALDKALNIANNGFCISSDGSLMLGHGIYFARSFKDTGNKARFKGMCHFY